MQKQALDVWKTRDGREIPYSELDDEHLINIILMLKHNALIKFIEIVANEARTMSNLDDMMYDWFAEHACEEKIKWYDLDRKLVPLIKEAQGRGLDLTVLGTELP